MVDASTALASSSEVVVTPPAPALGVLCLGSAPQVSAVSPVPGKVRRLRRRYRRRKGAEASPPPVDPTASLRKPLSLNDWLFVEACLDTIKKYGHVNRLEAYRVVYPNTTYNSAKSSAWKKFTNPCVQEAIEARLKAEKLTRQTVIAVMWEALEKLREAGKSAEVISGAIDILRARGELVDKRQDVTPEKAYSREELVAELRKRTEALPN